MDAILRLHYVYDMDIKQVFTTNVSAHTKTIYLISVIPSSDIPSQNFLFANLLGFYPVMLMIQFNCNIEAIRFIFFLLNERRQAFSHKYIMTEKNIFFCKSHTVHEWKYWRN